MAQPVDLAQTHLNICVTLSQLGRHQLARDHAQTALELIENCQTKDAALIELEIITRYNLATELEHLKLYAEAAQEYEKGHLFGTQAKSKNLLVPIMKNLKVEIEVRLAAQERRQLGLLTRRRESDIRNYKHIN